MTISIETQFGSNLKSSLGSGLQQVTKALATSFVFQELVLVFVQFLAMQPCECAHHHHRCHLLLF